MKNLVIIPVYNEEKTLEAVLNRIRQYHPGDILAINDGSTDGSLEILKSYKNLQVIVHPVNKGYGQALIDGYTYASENDYEYVVTVDCDKQHEPGLIPTFLEKVQGTDILSGTRYLCVSDDNDPPPPDRRNINRIITEAINQVTGYTLTDSFCGFKCISVKALKNLQLTVTGYGIPVQFWLQAKFNGYTVREYAIPRIYKNLNRKFGGGMDDPMTRLEYYKSILEEEAKRCSFKIPDHLFSAASL